MNNATLTVAFRILALLTSLSFLVNGGYEYFFLSQTADAAFSLALSALMLNWYMDSRKQDKRI